MTCSRVAETRVAHLFLAWSCFHVETFSSLNQYFSPTGTSFGYVEFFHFPDIRPSHNVFFISYIYQGKKTSTTKMIFGMGQEVYLQTPQHEIMLACASRTITKDFIIDMAPIYTYMHIMYSGCHNFHTGVRSTRNLDHSFHAAPPLYDINSISHDIHYHELS